MARDFDGTDDYWEADTSAQLSSGAISLWIKVDALPSSNEQVMSFKNSGDGQPYGTHDKNLILNTDGTITARIFSNDEHQITSTATVSAGTWAHIGMSIGSTTSRGLRVWVDGAYAAFTGTGSDSSFTGYSTPAVGIAQTASSYSRFDGMIGEVALFSDPLTDDDWAALALGITSRQVRPDACIDCWPCVGGTLANHFGGDPLTNSGSTVADDHPSIILPTAQILQFPPSSGGGPAPSHPVNPFGHPFRGALGGPIG